MAAMKEYQVEINGSEHVLLLDAEDAKRYAGAQLVKDVVEAVAAVVEPVVEPVEPAKPAARKR